MVATFLAFSGIGVVDPILPSIAEQIGASHWQVEMLFTAYILTMAIMMLPAGIFASRFGDKRMMTIGLGDRDYICVYMRYIANDCSIISFPRWMGIRKCDVFATAMTLLIALSKEVHEAVGLYEATIGLGMAGTVIRRDIRWTFLALPIFATSILIFLAFILVFFL